MVGKSKVSPEEVISSDSSDSEDTGLFKFLHLKRRKLDKEILIWIPEPERAFIERRYNTDMSYVVYMETASTASRNYGGIVKDYGQRQSNSKNTQQQQQHIVGLSSNNKPINFLLKGTSIRKSSNVSSTRPHPPFMQNASSPAVGIQNKNPSLGLPAVVKRVPGSIDLVHAHTTRNTNPSSIRPPERKQINKSPRGCSVS